MSSSVRRDRTDVATGSPAPGTPVRRRAPAWWRWASYLLAVLALVAVLALLGVAWYFSGVALTVTAAGQATVTAEADGADRVWLSREGFADYEGLHGLRSEQGEPVVGVVSDILEDSGERVLRSFEPVSGTLPQDPETMVMDQSVFWPDPEAVGLAFEEVVLDGELGPLPSWVVPGAGGGDTWAVFVHGRGGTLYESLRFLPTLHEAGVTTLVISYRNDAGAAADPEGRYRLGDTEWRDVETALAHTRGQGAVEVVLMGVSMGAAISLQAVDRSAEADLVSGLWLDAPVLDWRDTFVAQGGLNGVPRPATEVAIGLIQLRGGMDLDDFDWVARADELPDVPIHVEHSDGDSFVPNGPSLDLAVARPDLVTLVHDSSAEHTRSWNADPQGYDERLRAWLAALP